MPSVDGPQSGSEPESSPAIPSEGDAESCALEGQARAHGTGPAASWNPGTIAGRYTVVSKLGQGGMAEVYLLRDSRTNEFVAAKRPIGEFLSVASLREQFLREVSAWTRLAAHPNIVNAFDAGEPDGLPCILMEYVSGGTLTDVIRCNQAGAPLAEVLKAGIQVCWAMEFAHQEGLIHRDLKPSNILLTPAGDAKVTDFGLVVAARDPGAADSSSIAPPTAPGTWAYMPPEQWEGEASTRTDIYSFGVTLYLLLTGRHPFAEAIAARGVGGDGSGEEASFYRGLSVSATPVDPVDVNPGIPGALRGLVLSCLAKKPENRPSDFRQAGDLLAELYQQLPNGRALTKPVGVALDLHQQGVRAWALLRTGAGAQGRGDTDRAMDQYREAEGLLGELGDTIGLCTCHNLIGSVHGRRGEVELALSRYRKSLELAPIDPPCACTADAWLGMGNAWRDLGDLHRATDAYARSSAAFEQIHDRRGMAGANMGRGIVLRDLGRLDEALEMYRSSLDAYSKLGDRHMVPAAKSNMAETLQQMGRLDEALALYREALEAAEQIGAKPGVAVCRLNIGEVTLKLGDAEGALNWYAEAAELFETIGDKARLANCLVFIGGAYERLARWPSARTAYRRSVELRNSCGLPVPPELTEKIARVEEQMG